MKVVTRRAVVFVAALGLALGSGAAPQKAARRSGPRYLKIDGEYRPIKGINLPWFNGACGHDFGHLPTHPDWGVSFNRSEMAATLDDIKSLNVNVVRIWVFESMEGVQFDKRTGLATGIEPLLLENFDITRDLARERGLYLYLTLATDVLHICGELGVKDMVRDAAARRAWTEKVVKPFAAHYKGDPTVFAIDVFNEPEFNVAGPRGNNGDKGYDWTEMRRFLKETVHAVHAADPKRLVSCGSGWHAETNVKDGVYGGLGLDFYDYHQYNDDGALPPARDLNLGLPVLIGECGQGKKERDDEAQRRAVEGFLRNAKDRGYAGAVVWSYGSGDQHRILRYDGGRNWRPAATALRGFRWDGPAEPAASARPRPAPVGLDELAIGVPEFAPWLSGDGREIYWTTQAGPGQEMWVWSARRKGPGSPFEGVRRLFSGGSPTLTGDGLTMICIDRANQLHVASRASADAQFGEPAPIGSLRREGVRCRMPCLTGDGLTLYFERSEAPGKPWEFWSSRRAGPRDAWGPPEPVPIVQADKPVVPSFPYVTADGLTLLGIVEWPNGKGLMAWTRAGTELPFDQPQRVIFPGAGKFPSNPAFFRFCEKTNEVVFSGAKEGESRPSLWLISDFGLPGREDGAPAGGRALAPEAPVRLVITISKGGDCQIKLGRWLLDEAQGPADGLVPITNWYSAGPVDRGQGKDRPASLRVQASDPKDRGRMLVYPRAFRLPCALAIDITQFVDARLGVQLVTPSDNFVVYVESEDDLQGAGRIVAVSSSSPMPGGTGVASGNPQGRLKIEKPVRLDRPEELRFHLPMPEGRLGDLLTLDAVVFPRAGKPDVRPSATIRNVVLRARKEKTLGMVLGVDRGKLVVEGVEADGLAGIAGVEVGDVVVALNGKKLAPVADATGLTMAMEFGISPVADLTLLRGGKERAVSIKLD